MNFFHTKHNKHNRKRIIKTHTLNTHTQTHTNKQTHDIINTGMGEKGTWIRALAACKSANRADLSRPQNSCSFLGSFHRNYTQSSNNKQIHRPNSTFNRVKERTRTAHIVRAFLNTFLLQYQIVLVIEFSWFFPLLFLNHKCIFYFECVLLSIVSKMN